MPKSIVKIAAAEIHSNHQKSAEGFGAGSRTCRRGAVLGRPLPGVEKYLRRPAAIARGVPLTQFSSIAAGSFERQAGGVLRRATACLGGDDTRE